MFFKIFWLTLYIIYLSFSYLKVLILQIIVGQNSHISLFEKIYMNLSLFAKYLVTTTFLKLDFVGIEFSMVLEFMELKYHEKNLKFFDVTRVRGTPVTSKTLKRISWYLTTMEKSIFTKSNLKKMINC